MANNLQIDLPLNPVLDVGKFNVLLNELKTSMGPLGKDIQPIDEAKYKAAIQAAKKSVDELTSSEKKAGDETDNLNKKAQGLSKALQFGFIAQGIKAATDSIQSLAAPIVKLDTATQSMKTLGEEAAALAPTLRQAALEMSTTLPVSAAQLQQGMTDALASGVKGGESGLKTFAETAAKLATGGGADFGSVVKGLGATLNAYGESSDKAGKYADTFFNVVNFGVTTIDELNSYLSQVTPTASAMGVSFENVGASLALMTQKGVPTAQATTKLNQLFIEMQKPGEALKKILGDAGLSVEGLGKTVKEKGLPEALAQMQVAFDKAGKSATQAFSSSEAGAAFNLLASDINAFKQTLGDVSNTTGSTENAFKLMSDSIEVKTKQMQSNIDTFITRSVDSMGGFGIAAITTSNMLGQMQAPLTALAGIKTIIPAGAFSTLSEGIKGLVPAFITAGATGTTAGASVMAAWLPVIGIIAGVAALGVGLYALSGGFDKSSESKLHDTQETIKNVEANKKANLEAQEREKQNASLILQYEKLIKANDGSAASEKELADIRSKLNDRYPELVKMTGNHADNLKRVKEYTGLANDGFAKLDGHTKSLITGFETLGKKEKKSTEEKKRLQDITNQLNELYPKVNANAGDYTGTMERLKNQTGGLTNEMLKLRTEYEKYGKQLAELGILEARRTRDKLKDDIISSYNEITGYDYAKGGQRNLIQRAYESIIKTTDTGNLQKATSKYIDEIQLGYYDFFGKIQKWDNTTQQSLKANIIKIGEAQRQLFALKSNYNKNLFDNTEEKANEEADGTPPPSSTT